jgi:thiamine pyrophosphate-dependent acetolactate synthase large subunit-like protein
MRFYQSVNSVKLMQDVALFNEQVTGPAHALFIANRACRAALGGRGVAQLTVAKDPQNMKLSADKPSMENHGGRTSTSWSAPMGAPPADQIRAAGDILNSGRRVVIFAGQGCLFARAEIERLAETLGAPVPKSYLAKALLPDRHPLTAGGIGHLGAAPSSWTTHNCDTVLILAPANAACRMDCGANTHFAARMIQIRDGQSRTGTGTLVSVASGLPLAIAGAFAHPDRPSIAVVGDGGFAMLMAELSTAVFHRPERESDGVE